MTILEQLKNNRGSLSTTLSKEIARKILEGKRQLLKESIPLVTYRKEDLKDKNIRIGAAIIIDTIAKEKPSLIAPYLESLLPALEVKEPQTRWIIIRTIGYCIKEKPEIAEKALEFAKRYIGEKKEGQLCLVASTDMFLGEYGAQSKAKSNKAFSLLMKSTENVITNEHDWILEAFIKISPYLTRKQKYSVLSFAENYKTHPRKATRERIRQVEECCER